MDLQSLWSPSSPLKPCKACWKLALEDKSEATENIKKLCMEVALKTSSSSFSCYQAEDSNLGHAWQMFIYSIFKKTLSEGVS